MYLIERYLRRANADTETIIKIRAKTTKPLLVDFHELLVEQQAQVIPKGLLGRAISYALNLWPRLTLFADAADLPIDNNITENAIRPFAVGRKNWLFSQTPHGAFASAAMYSVIQSAIANGLDPYEYLRFLFDRLPNLRSVESFREIAPNRIRQDKFVGAGKN